MENLLLEGRYDKVTTELSKEMVRAIVQGKKRIQTRIILFTRTYVDVSFYIHYDDGQPIDVYGATYITPTEIRKHYKNKRIVLHANVPKDIDLRKKNMNGIVAEVKNIVRHEIEHVTQSKFTDRQRQNFFSSKRSYPENIDYWEYLMEPYEVEAYIRGMYKKAKTIKQPLNVILNDWWVYLNEWTDEKGNKMHQDEINAIKKAWIDYAKKHLSQGPYLRKGDKLVPSRTYGYIDETNPNQPNGLTEAMGFRPSFVEPTVNAIINFDAPDTKVDLKPILTDILDTKGVKINSISCGNLDSTFKSCRLDLMFFSEREVQHLIDDLHRVLMVNHDTRIKDVTNYIK